MRIVRGCDAKRNTLVYLVYSDRPIEGSPKNSTSSVPLMPWGTEPAPRCADFGVDYYEAQRLQVISTGGC